jgi:glycosyltransferase involved in cell wall biosynthesis
VLQKAVAIDGLEELARASALRSSALLECPADASNALLDSGTPIAFLGTYGPRRCGIATFTEHLAAAVAGVGQRVAPIILAVTDPSAEYVYPGEVEFEIRQDVKADYTRAAEFVNRSRVRLVSIQHEYGIFGGDDGAYVLDFVRALRVPTIVTLHTVLKRPSAQQAAIVGKLVGAAAQVIVMSQVAHDLLSDSYGLRGPKIRMIPHGIPVMDRTLEQYALKAKFGVAGRPLLLTFGLLSPNKGIETVIRALPAVVREFPDMMYFIVGTTHPAVLRRDGEAYRTMIEHEVERLGVRAHVKFRDEFVGDRELHEYLQAADVFVSPYLNEAQVTSGALSYAMGAGAAVVSTPYWHAQELLSSGRGRLFPFGDHNALATVLLDLFASPHKLHAAREAAFAYSRSMVWPQIGNAYFDVIADALQAAGAPSLVAVRHTIAPTTLPDLCLDHLRRMTDDTGIIQHATYTVPARSSGYCVDDNARALMVALHADRLQTSRFSRALVSTYISYLHGAQDSDGVFRNFMSYARVRESASPSDDCVGRAIWALGVAAELAAEQGVRQLARDMLSRALPSTRSLGPRGTAQAVLGLVHWLAADHNAPSARDLLDELVAKLLESYANNASSDWRWFEPTLTYDNAILPLALFAAHGVTGEHATLRTARESLGFLEEVCFEGERLHLVGNTGWHSCGGTKALADEQAIDAAAFVLAFRRAYAVTNDAHYLRRMREAFSWFVGSNRLGLALYDPSTGGCRDGMGVSQVNQNQGAESTVCFLLALLQMLDAAGEDGRSGAEEARSDERAAATRGWATGLDAAHALSDAHEPGDAFSRRRVRLHSLSEGAGRSP